EAYGGCRIVVARPYEAMLSVIPALYPPPPPATGIHPTAVIGSGVSLGSGVSIGPYAVVEDRAVLGDDVRVGAHSTVARGVRVGEGGWVDDSVPLYPGAEIGRRVRLHAGVRGAGDGFGYVQSSGRHEKIPHVGRCILEDDVE